MWTWNDETPGSVPCGARISAGKFGKVARSLPKIAEASVNRAPASCMPSPESPAKRMRTESTVCTSASPVASTGGASLDTAQLLKASWGWRVSGLGAPRGCDPCLGVTSSVPIACGHRTHSVVPHMTFTKVR